MSLLTEKFTKSERLCSRKAIGRLFEGGRELFHYPFRLLWNYAEDNNRSPVKVAIAVPRKKIRKAVHRNRVKRLIREAYRQNKHIIYENHRFSGRNIDMVIIYVSGSIHNYDHINLRLVELLKRLISADEIS